MVRLRYELYENCTEDATKKVEHITIAEDDVVLPQEYLQEKKIVDEYLSVNKEWDIFSGLIADLNKSAKILKIDYFKGMTFVTLDKLVSTVYNIYSKRALEILSQWNPSYMDVHTNTIDRYLENSIDIRVVVKYPFFVSHREELDSTIWGIGNSGYNDMIMESEKRLSSMIKEYQEKKE